MLSFTHVKQGTPTKGLEVAYDLLPMDLFLLGSVISTLERVKFRNPQNWDGIGLKNQRGHLFLAERSKGTLGLGDINMTPPKYQENFRKNYYIDIKSFDHGGAPDEFLPFDYQAFTDGSKRDSRTGWGYHIIDKRSEKVHDSFGQLDGGNTVFQAEIMAINMAAKKAINLAPGAVDFYVDSQGALLALDKAILVNALLQECANTLNLLGQVRKVSLHWIKAHAGYEHNELVNDLAQEGTTKTIEASDPAAPLPTSLFKRMLKEALYDKWGKKWNIDSKTQCRQSHTIMPKPNPNFSRRLLDQNRDTLSLLIQAITGFNNLNYHQYNCKKSSTLLCRLCNESREELIHLLNNCPATARLRQQYNFNLTLEDPPSFTQLLGFLTDSHINSLFKHRVE